MSRQRLRIFACLVLSGTGALIASARFADASEIKAAELAGHGVSFDWRDESTYHYLGKDESETFTGTAFGTTTIYVGLNLTVFSRNRLQIAPGLSEEVHEHARSIGELSRDQPKWSYSTAETRAHQWRLQGGELVFTDAGSGYAHVSTITFRRIQGGFSCTVSGKDFKAAGEQHAVTGQNRRKGAFERVRFAMSFTSCRVTVGNPFDDH